MLSAPHNVLLMSRLALLAIQSRDGSVSPTLGRDPSVFHRTGPSTPRITNSTVDKDLRHIASLRSAAPAVKAFKTRGDSGRNFPTRNRLINALHPIPRRDIS